jgi:hypothetical protein
VACIRCHSAGVEPPPIGPGTARFAADAEDPLDLPSLRPSSAPYHRLCRWGEGWRRPATVAVEPPLLTACSSRHLSPPAAVIVAQHRTRAWIRVTDAIGGGREEACSNRRCSESSRHRSSLDPQPRHRCSGEIHAARPRSAAARPSCTHTHTQREKGSDSRRVTRCRVVAGGGGRRNPRRRRPIGVVVVAPDGAGARSGVQRCRGSMWCWMVARGPTQRWHLVIMIVATLGGGITVK